MTQNHVINTAEGPLNWPLEDIVPREVQIRAIEKGFGKPGFAYFMRQRLGKTWTAYAEFTLLQQQEKVDWMFIVCPNSIKNQWAEAVAAVDPFMPVRIYQASQKAKTKYWFENNKIGGVFIINYESVHSFISEEDWWKRFDPLRTYLVADESTKIADFKSQMTKACLQLSEICAYKRVLTGKPSKGMNDSLWGQLKFINATERNYHQFKYYYTLVGGWMGKQSVENVNEAKLKDEMEPHCYIAEDKYIVGFEKVYEPLREVKLTGDLKSMYDKMEDELIVELNSGTNITAPIALVKYLRLQQIASGIAGDIEGNQVNLIEPDKNPRIKLVKELLESEIDHKVIIVCRFRKSIENLYKVLTDEGYKVAVMVGGMGDELDVQKRLFNEEHDILIAQEQVLNFGHTLCGPDDYPCDSVIYYENSFSLTNRSQTESRPEKMGRNKPISYYDFYASPMCRYIIEKLRKKEDAAMAIMGYKREYGILNRGDY